MIPHRCTYIHTYARLCVYVYGCTVCMCMGGCMCMRVGVCVCASVCDSVDICVRRVYVYESDGQAIDNDKQA